MPRVFLSYQADCPKTAVQVRHLHREINSVESDYEKILRELTTLPPERSLLIPIEVHALHKRTENVLVLLLDFFRIAVDGARRKGDTTHRYHAAILEALRHPDNPLRHVLGAGQAQDILWSWKRWRNKWVKRKDDDQMEAAEDMKRVGLEMPVLLERLREAVSVANGIARRGEQVVRLDGVRSE